MPPVPAKAIEMWKEMCGLPVVRCDPLSVNGSLLAVGGLRQDEAMSDIFLYQPDYGEWVKVGEMIAPRFDCTSATITGKELLVVGGRECDIGAMFDSTTIGSVARPLDPPVSQA